MEKEVKPSTEIKKSNKKLYLIIGAVFALAFLCMLTLIVIIILTFPKPTPKLSSEICMQRGLVYDETLNDCIVLETPTLTPTAEPTPTITPIEIDDTDEIVIDKNLTINYLTSPVKVADTVALFEESPIKTESLSTYKIGNIVNGTITNITKNSSLVFENNPLYLVAISPKPNGDLAGAWGTFIHYAETKDGNKYILDEMNYFNSFVASKSFNTDFTIVDFDKWNIPDKLYAQYTDESNDEYSLQSSKGVYYSKYLGYWPTLFSSQDLTPIDSLFGATIYMSNTDEYSRTFIKSNDGFLYSIDSIPTIVIDSNYQETPIAIKWNDNNSNKDNYSYHDIGTCFENGLEVDKNPPQLSKLGTTTTGQAIYEASSTNEAYRKDIYDNFYIVTGMHEYNAYTEDDVTPFTYEQYLKLHPVFYWKDEFGRYIRFANDNFVMAGGCGKPVIYMYPEQDTAATVKVIPNGRLTLTVPTIGDNSTWSVLAKKNSSIIDLRSGKTYEYLWWESQGVKNAKIPQAGYVLANATLEADLRGLLLQTNMTTTEINAFCDYWLPLMEKDNANYYFVTFLFNEQVDQIAQLEFTPEPNVVNRLFMVYTPLTQLKKVKPLTLEKFVRNGYYIVEWGGAKL